MPTVLVAYASKHHATAEIADAIGEELRQAGLKVDIRDVNTINSIAPYEAVIVGSAVYVGQWQSAAIQFLETHEGELSQRPVWLFSSGPTGEGDPVALMKGWAFPESLKPLAERIAPRDIALFHGKIDPTRLNFLERAAVKMVKAPVADSRDWKLIREWAHSIAYALQQTETFNVPPLEVTF
jgi:menaquinone-dependent protoporphyrinogen oxidase